MVTARIIVWQKDKRYMVPKHVWIQRLRFVFGKSKVEAQISWTHAEKVETDSGIEYGWWKGKLAKRQWGAKAEKEWLKFKEESKDRRHNNKMLNRAGWQQAKCLRVRMLQSPDWRSRFL